MKKILKYGIQIVLIYIFTGNLWAKTNENGFVEYTKKVSNCPRISLGVFTMDSTNNIYALHDHSVYIINPSSGKCSKPIYLSTGGSLIAVDKKRKFIYVTSGYNKIYQFNFTGKLIRSWDTSYLKDSMAVDKSGNIYIADTTNNYIQKYSATGKFLLKWGGEGAYDGRFNKPVSLAIDKNNDVYVADQGNSRIQKFDSSGHFITKWGHASTSSDDIYGFKHITQIAVDNNMKVYVADDYFIDNWSSPDVSRHDSVKMFYSNGDYIGSNKLRYIRSDRYHSLQNFHIDSVGNIYVGTSDRASISSVHKYNKDYHFIDSWGNQSIGRGEYRFIKDVVFDSKNNIYVLDMRSYSITKSSKYGTFIRRWGQSGSMPGEFDQEREIRDNIHGGIMSMAISSEDEIYVYDQMNNRVQKFDSNGKLLQIINIEETNNNAYSSIAIDARDNIYLLYSSSNSILVYNKYGKKISEWLTGKSIEHIIIDKKRNFLYASNSSEIIKYNLKGEVLTGWSLDYIGNIAVSPNGNLYLVCRQEQDNSPMLYEFSNSGIVLRKKFKVSGYGGASVDKLGNLYYYDFTKYGQTVFRKPVNPDRDNDGVINEKDAFPDNPNEWIDTDNDGIGNNADTDDDGDGMSDVLEIKYHFNPLDPADGSADADGDGFSNTIEVGLGYNPLSSASHPVWVPLIMGDIMAFIPAKP